MKSYAVKEVFLTLQGEGLRAGTLAVFCRFSGCNLWTGREEDRAKGSGACAAWCDTDFAKGSKTTAEQLVEAVERLWPAYGGPRWVVLTGGEPTLQVDDELLAALATAHLSVAVETNGTTRSPQLTRADHVCLSPKLNSAWRTLAPGLVTEVKVVLPGGRDPGNGWSDDELTEIERRYPRAALFVQPCDLGQSLASKLATQACVTLVRARPRWRLGVQVHKIIGLP